MATFSMDKKKDAGPRCFVQVGRYEGRNLRKESTFRVVETGDLEGLKAEVEKAVRATLKKA